MRKYSTQAKIKQLILDFYKGDLKKTDKWLRTKNPILGSVSPLDMMMDGKEKELLKIIEFKLSGNKR